LTIIYATTSIQENTKSEILGRVSSFNEIAIRTFLPIIFLGTSWVIPKVGLFVSLLIISFLVITILLITIAVGNTQGNKKIIP